ncbi:ATP-binding protein [Vibrio harveyi]|uniref:ATP-binding protein n=1 Tax=Vibrio harveyi TaxID=669 RepID=UPI002480B4B1|nr:ATP-binding protein [Vibrio harveyi]
MLDIFLKELEEAEKLGSKDSTFNHLTSVLRALLQHLAVISIELTNELVPSDMFDLPEYAHRLRRPADGSPSQILDALIPVLREHLHRDYMYGWFETKKGFEQPANVKVHSWVQFRNNRPGHGVLDEKNVSKWSEETKAIILQLLSISENFLPTVDVDGESLSLPDYAKINKLTTPLVHKNKAIVIRSIAIKKGVSKLRCQLLCRSDAEEIVIDLPQENVFVIESIRNVGAYTLVDVVNAKGNYSVFHNIPVRQTDTFEGRHAELEELSEWLDDLDSKYCLIYGDGGFGKTTLVLEFLNQLLEGEIDSTVPQVISYQTAKLTKWTSNGLVYLKGVAPASDEIVRELMRLFETRLDKSWFEVSGKALISKAETYLRKEGFSRDDVLLVIDNTEVYSEVSYDVRELGKFFKSLGRVVGRVIITSRRREYVEANPVLIEGLSDAECVTLMKRLAKEYNAQPITQASERTLRNVSKRLMCKPLLVHSLTKLISHTQRSIEDTLDTIFSKKNHELLDFLYQDAWGRMNDLQKNVFMVLVNISFPINNVAISSACQKSGIQVSEFESALNETYFCTEVRHEGEVFIEFVMLARNFFIKCFGSCSAQEKEEIKQVAKDVDKDIKRSDDINRTYREDRVAEAFRTDFAKAAKNYAVQGHVKEAIEMYELAIQEEPLNAALHDRFAWLLLNRTHRIEDARDLAKKSVKLDGNNCDARVSLALAYYRLFDVSLGDEQIDIAKKLGRTPGFCNLRKGIARYYKGKNESELKTSIPILQSSLDFLIKARKTNNQFDKFYQKNNEEIAKYISHVKALLKTKRALYTKQRSKKQVSLN